MTSSTNPTWYDVLGVSRDATPAQIKAAWRNATDKFEPGSGSGQFRMFNEAADVLLDPDRRAAYDESLGLPAAPAFTPDEDQAVPTDDHPVPSEEAPAAPEKEPATSHQPASRTVAMLTLLLAALTVAALVAAGYFGLTVRDNAQVADARDEAPAAAERAAKAVLAYDYRQLPADRKRASAFLTPDFRKEYLQNFTLLEKQKDGTPGAAVQTKTVVTAAVLGSGVIDADTDLARVLVYVNQTSTRPDRDPQIFQNRVALTMQKDGNRWLVDDLKSY